MTSHPPAPWGETLVAAYDPASGLYLPVRETILTSFTSLLWKNPSAFGETLTAVASPALPPEHVLTQHVWRLLLEAPDDPREHLTVLRKAAWPRVRKYHPQVEDLEAEIDHAILEILFHWQHTWTVGDAVRHRGENYFAAMPEYVRRYVKDVFITTLTAHRTPRDAEGNIVAPISLDVLGERGVDVPANPPVRDAGVLLYPTEVHLDTRLLWDHVAHETPEIQEYVARRLQGQNDAEIAAALGVPRMTLRDHLRRLSRPPGRVPRRRDPSP